VTAQVQVTGTGEKETADEDEKQAEEEAEVPILQPMKMFGFSAISIFFNPHTILQPTLKGDLV
jgi:hypothetical protein